MTGERPLVMGVLNVTPDSFSDGGLFEEPIAAVAHGERLVGEGAAVVDVGGRSTRPGAEPVADGDELRRVVSVVELLAQRLAAPHHGEDVAHPRADAAEPGSGVAPHEAERAPADPASARISIDTTRVDVARASLAAGARIVNDVSAFRGEPEMAGLVASSEAECCLMHMLGDPATMQDDPRYDDVVSEVKAFLEERLAFAVGEGVPEERVWLDPGIGFGKTVEHNLELLRRLEEIVAIGRPVVVGTSRKSFIGKLTGREVHERVAGTITTNVLAYERGASMFRVHDVAQVADALHVAAATVSGEWTASTRG